jgi:hypothetical protein
LKLKLLFLALALASAAVTPAFPHHSFAAEYDANKPITISGKVAKVDWVNPHAWIHVDVSGPDGKLATWACEMGAPNGLFRRGWNRTSVKPGEEVVIEGFAAKDGSNTMNSRMVKTADGRRLFAGSPDDGGPQSKGNEAK